MTNYVRKMVRILSAHSLPRRSRVDYLSFKLWCMFRKRGNFAINLGYGKVILSFESAKIDAAVFEEIFLEECYQTDYNQAIVLDIGAHKGYFGAYAILRGATKAYAFEPERVNFELLTQATATFNTQSSQWIAEKVAVGSREGEAELYVTEQSWSHSLFPRFDRQIIGTETVPVRPLSQIIQDIKKYGSKVIVKIDVEGAECDIVLATNLEYWKSVDELFIEYHKGLSTCRWSELESHLSMAGLKLLEKRNTIYRFVRR